MVESLRRLDGSMLFLANADSIIRALVSKYNVSGLQIAVANDGTAS